MMSLSDDKQADIIDALNTASRYLDDILNINNVYFDNMVDIVSTKFYDKRDDFDFEIVNFAFLMVIFLSLHPMESRSLN